MQSNICLITSVFYVDNCMSVHCSCQLNIWLQHPYTMLMVPWQPDSEMLE